MTLQKPSNSNEAETLVLVRGSQVSDHLNAIRGLAALGVFLGHARNLFLVDYSELQQSGLFTKSLYFLSGLGHQMVMVFFVMSGYFISSSILHDLRSKTWSWKKYLTSRLVRLYVVLLPALVLTAIWDFAGITLSHHHPIYDGAGPQNVIESVKDRSDGVTLIGNALFLQTVFVKTFGSNGPLWSLSNEFWYYLIFPCICVAANQSFPTSKRLLHALTAITIIVAVWPLMNLFPVWLFGAVLPIAPRFKKLDHQGFRLAVLMPAVAGCVFAILIARIRAIPPLLSDYTLGLIFAFAVYVLLHSAVSQSSKSYRIIATELAGMSYSLYLTHLPLLVFLFAVLQNSQRWQADLNGMLHFCSVLFVTFAFSLGFAKLTEAKTDVCRKRLSEIGRNIVIRRFSKSI